MKPETWNLTAVANLNSVRLNSVRLMLNRGGRVFRDEISENLRFEKLKEKKKKKTYKKILINSKWKRMFNYKSIPTGRHQVSVFITWPLLAIG